MLPDSIGKNRTRFLPPVKLGLSGPIAQLVERLAGSQEVRGSNPLGSTFAGQRVYRHGLENGSFGYSPCLPLGPSDYDCAGGEGNGPAYTEPGVTYQVTGSDPYGLDGSDNDGLGCE